MNYYQYKDMEPLGPRVNTPDNRLDRFAYLCAKTFSIIHE